MKIFNLTILKTEDYEDEIAQLNADYQNLHKEYDNFHSQMYKKCESDIKQIKIQLEYEEKAKLAKIRKLVKNNNEILKELEKLLKNPNMFESGEDYKNYAEAYLKLKQETIDFIK